MSDKIKEEKLVEIEINFQQIRDSQLDESFLRMFGSWTKTLLNAMFGGLDAPIKVTGTRSEVESYARALGNEKNYLSSVKRFGLDDRRTYQSKYKLEAAVKGFEKETGIPWPFK